MILISSFGWLDRISMQRSTEATMNFHCFYSLFVGCFYSCARARACVCAIRIRVRGEKYVKKCVWDRNSIKPKPKRTHTRFLILSLSFHSHFLILLQKARTWKVLSFKWRHCSAWHIQEKKWQECSFLSQPHSSS